MRTDGSTNGTGTRRGHAREGILVALALLAMGVVGFSLSTGRSDDERDEIAEGDDASRGAGSSRDGGVESGAPILSEGRIPASAPPVLEGRVVVEKAPASDGGSGGIPAGELAQAPTEADYRAALRRSPNDVGSLNGLARVLLASGRPGEALRTALRATAMGGDGSESHRLAGRAYHTLGMAREARAAYEHAIRLDPGDAWALNNLGLLAIEEERSSAALAPLALAAQLAPGEARIRNNLGIALERCGRVYAASEEYADALAADSTFARAAENLARVSPLRESPDLGPLDLDALAAEFLRELSEGPAVASKAPSVSEPEEAGLDEEGEETGGPR